jgi:hypothetical protein
VYPDPKHESEIFAKRNFRKTKFCEIARKVSEFSLIIVFAKMKKGVFVSTLLLISIFKVVKNWGLKGFLHGSGSVSGLK